MNNVRFDIKCEGDIEAYIAFSKERVLAKKETSVTLGVPTMAWPEMIIDMFQQDTWGMPKSDKVYMSVDFDVANEDGDILDEHDLDGWEAKLAAMDDDEIQDFINDMMDELDKKYPLRDSDEESDDDEDESPEGNDQ